jgi:hypothetical protein
MSPYVCTYQQAEYVAQWFRDNSIGGGVSKEPYDPWTVWHGGTGTPTPDASQIAEWLVDTNNGNTGISCRLTMRQIQAYGSQVAAGMCKDMYGE